MQKIIKTFEAAEIAQTKGRHIPRKGPKHIGEDRLRHRLKSTQRDLYHGTKKEE